MNPAADHGLSWSLHTWMGFVYFLLLGLALLTPFVKKHSRTMDRLLSPSLDWLSGQVSDPFRKFLMGLLTVSAAGLYIYCLTCLDRASLSAGEADHNIFHVTAKLAMRVFPFFMIGCFFAGLIEKYFRQGRFPLPKSMLGNGLFASLVPMCSCAVVPLAQSMMHLHRIRVRAVITFLMVAPVLTPLVIPLSIGVLGWPYLGLRVVAAFAIGMITGLVVERWVGIAEGEGAAFSCVGCSKSSAVKPEHAGSALMLGWNTALNLLPYILVGVAIGAAFTVYLPPSLVGQYLSNGSLGLVLSALVGIPVYICSGEEIIILSPLMEMGLPMGHAIAFTITGNAICLTSIAILIPAFGRKTTFIMVGALFIGSIVAGAIINLAYSIL